MFLYPLPTAPVLYGTSGRVLQLYLSSCVSSTTSHALYIDPLTVVVDQGQNIEGGDKRELAGSIICSLAIVGHVGKGLL